MKYEEARRVLEDIIDDNVDALTINFIVRRYIPEESIRDVHVRLLSYGCSADFLREHSMLLGLNPDMIESNYQTIVGWGANSTNIDRYGILLHYNSNTLARKYQALRKLGLTHEQITSIPELVARKSKVIRENYDFLRKNLGISHRTISNQLQLLTLGHNKLDEIYEKLKDWGFSFEAMARCPSLLGNHPETLQRKFDFLEIKLGVARKKIAVHPSLLTISLESLESRYNNHRKSLQTYSLNDDQAALLIRKNPQLLQIPETTFDSNLTYLSYIGLDIPTEYNLAQLLSTRPSTKRKKLAWILREVCGYSFALPEKRSELIHTLYDFISSNTNTLVHSISYLEKYRDRLKLKYQKYLDESLR